MRKRFRALSKLMWAMHDIKTVKRKCNLLHLLYDVKRQGGRMMDIGSVGPKNDIIIDIHAARAIWAFCTKPTDPLC